MCTRRALLVGGRGEVFAQDMHPATMRTHDFPTSRGALAFDHGAFREGPAAMHLPRALLVPFDFSEHSELALDYALALGAKLDATVHLLHVITIAPLGGGPELGITMSASMIDTIMKETQTALNKLANSKRAQAKIGEVMVRTGDARDVIVDVATHVRADMIIMGTHGRRGLTRALLGSVAETVVRTAPCAVLTTRARGA